MSKDLTSRTFSRSHAGQATEKRRNVKLAQGGRNADVQPGQAAVTKTRGKTGVDDVHGPGKQFGGGGYGTPYGKSKVGIAAPAGEGRTGNVHGSKPRPR
jgi:hypothetical protein